MADPELTDELIAEAMARAETVECRPGDDRCYPFPDPVADARASCTPKGWCRIGWIEGNTGRDSWDVCSTCTLARVGCGVGQTEASCPLQASRSAMCRAAGAAEAARFQQGNAQYDPVCR